MFEKQIILPTYTVGNVNPLRTNYANYYSNSVTNGTNALIDVLGETIIVTNSGENESESHNNTLVEQG